jgi:GH35 family endo-1,4-beta-xylanase
MKKVFAIVLIFTLAFFISAYAQDSSETTVKQIKIKKLIKESKKKNTIDAVGQQYLFMLNDYNNQLNEAKSDIKSNSRIALMIHENMMSVYETAHADNRTANRSTIDRLEKEYNQKLDDNKILEIKIKEIGLYKAMCI